MMIDPITSTTATPMAEKKAISTKRPEKMKFLMV
jgi:hypothetical protein